MESRRRLPPLNALRAFEAAARHLNFSRAADELSVTPGAVSQQIQNLEDYVGAALFKRTPKGLLLTDAAQTALPALREAFDRLAEAASLRGEELADEVMMVRRHCEVLAQTSRYFTDRNVRPAFSYRGVNDDRVMAMVRAGLGITVMPDSYREAGVARVKLEGFTPRRIVGLCYAGPAARYRTSGFVQAARELAAA